VHQVGDQTKAILRCTVNQPSRIGWGVWSVSRSDRFRRRYGVRIFVVYDEKNSGRKKPFSWPHTFYSILTLVLAILCFISVMFNNIVRNIISQLVTWSIGSVMYAHVSISERIVLQKCNIQTLKNSIREYSVYLTRFCEHNYSIQTFGLNCYVYMVD